MILDISKQRLNYDIIAHLYDEPMRDYLAAPHLLTYLEERGGRNRPFATGWSMLLMALGWF